MSIPKDGFIYIIQQKDSNYYKIGCTQDDNIEKRLSGNQVGNPQELILVGSFYTFDLELEKSIHQYLIEKSTYIRGEWFELSEDIVLQLLDVTWREEHEFYSDNLELTINSIFQEYAEISYRMNTLMKKLRHVISHYRIASKKDLLNTE